MEKFFKLKENGTTVKTEIVAGITTFMTMAYILAVNPNILSAAGMDHGAVFTATALAAMIGTLMMALFANYPFALAPGMGLNAYFAYTVVLGMGYSWQAALTAVFVEGIVFIVLSLTNVREAIFNAIPLNLKSAVSVGIGLFIAFIGLQNAKIVLPNSSTVAGLYSLAGYNDNLKSAAALNGTEYVAGTFNDVGITVILAVIGVIITAVLVVRQVRGNILWGILITWILGIICQLTGLYVPNPANGFYGLLPDFSNGLAIPSLSPIFLKLDFSILKSAEFFVIMFAFLFVDMFDTIGTLIGVSSKAGMLDQDGKLPNIRGALMADAVGTAAGALLGTSTTTTFVESASGVSEGGRTGLTAVTTAVLFGVSLFLSPIFLAIPSFATAPALIVVGFYMLTNVANIDFNDLSEAIPCYICIGAMPFFYSISEGIAMGVISYVAIQLISGKAKDKKISILMYVLAILFILKYILL
ncbi:MAG TPA: guanine permease [Lachnospiraceae bacterium]|nr:guanine permease [Lachnospiraceae bacterium]